MDLDDHVWNHFESCSNLSIDRLGRSQAQLPLRFGGIGLRSVSDLALPAFLSSSHANDSLVHRILHNPSESVDSCYLKALETWGESGLVLPLPQCSGRQGSWDDILCEQRRSTLKEELNQHRLACLVSASEPHSGAWLEVIPSSSLGTLLDPEGLRIGIGLRLGQKICMEHTCRCGRRVDNLGLHPLACRRSAGRFPRHSLMNSIVLRALESAGFPSRLEPVGLDRGDGKRPDGITIFPFSRGKCLTWDSACTDTFSRSNLISSASAAGGAARVYEDLKKKKYSGLAERFIFHPVVVETSGVFGPDTLSFLQNLGGLISKRTGDNRETQWLLQRLGLAVVRGNSHAILSAGNPP